MGPEWWLKLLYATLFGVVVMMQTVFMPVLLLPCIKVGDKTLREFVSPVGPTLRARLFALWSSALSASAPVLKAAAAKLSVARRWSYMEVTQVSKWTDLTRCLAYGDSSTFAAQSFPISGIPIWNAKAICGVPPSPFPTLVRARAHTHIHQMHHSLTHTDTRTHTHTHTVRCCPPTPDTCTCAHAHTHVRRSPPFGRRCPTSLTASLAR